MKNTLLAGLVCLAFVSSANAQTSPYLGNAPKAVRLGSVISHIDLRSGAEGIGGATVDDAVSVLRKLAGFPICFEEVEHDQAKDGLTLGAAIVQLRKLQAEQELDPRDQVRLKRYEEMSITNNPATFFVGFTRKSFILIQDNITVETFLNRITELDPTYTWKNAGTDEFPLVIIRPRKQSVLDLGYASNLWGAERVILC